jgi:hypothetical protein
MLIKKSLLSNSISLLAFGNRSAEFWANVIANFTVYLMINSGLIPSGETICEYGENYVKYNDI